MSEELHPTKRSRTGGAKSGLTTRAQPRCDFVLRNSVGGADRENSRRRKRVHRTLVDEGPRNESRPHFVEPPHCFHSLPTLAKNRIERNRNGEIGVASVSERTEPLQ